jgi:hypothetical protein
VGEERLGCLELCSLRPDAGQPTFDHGGPTAFAAMQHLADLSQAHSSTLARLKDPQAIQVFLGVDALPGRGAPWDDHALLVPVP